MNKSPPKAWLHPGYSHALFREWQKEAILTKSNLLYPIFVCDEPDAKQPINSLPDQYRWGVNRLNELISPLVKKGLQSVLIFGVLTSTLDNSLQYQKDSNGSVALSDKSPVILALKYLRKHYPSLVLACDVCLCAFTDHGHCGLLTKDGYINNHASIERIAEVAVHYAKSGAHIVAPSDMMDGRIKIIRHKLYENNLAGRCAVMSYAVKYCSSFYGPFRDACHSSPKTINKNKEEKEKEKEKEQEQEQEEQEQEQQEQQIYTMKDRSMYQLPLSSRGLGIKAALRCYKEGADFIMIKPGGPYLDMIRDVKNLLPHTPIAVYQVSGEYAMLWHGAEAKAFDLKDAVLETCFGFRRAGATIIITYFTPKLLDWLSEKESKL